MTAMDDTERNIMWDLRFEACENNQSCNDEPGMYHHDTCPRHDDYEPVRPFFALPGSPNDCMDCPWENKATWRSDDGYPFCEQCAYCIYVQECGFSNVEPFTYDGWVADNRPHGPSSC
jgi:hypothetical protein